MEFEEPDGPLPGEYHRILGPKTGVIPELAVIPPARDEPQVHVGTTRQTDPGILRGAEPTELDTGGKSLDPSAALRGAIGETCERYAYHWPDESAIEFATYEALDGRVVDFEYLTPHGQDRPESPLERFTRETEVAWTTGTDLVTGEDVYVPATKCWYRYGPLADRPFRFVMTSSGTAAGERLADAVLGGIYEVVERDAFMTTWCTGRTPPRVDLDAFPGVEATVEEAFPMDATTPHLFEYEGHTSFATVGAALVDERDRYPKFVMGGGAALDAEPAMLDALTEVGQAWPYLKQLPMDRDGDVSLDDTIANLDDNVMLYAQPENFEHVSFLLDGDPSVPGTPDVSAGTVGDGSAETTEDELATAISLLDDAGCTPIAVDVTPPDVDRIGIHVVKVFVPELVPFSLPSFPPRHHPKLDGVDVNSLPHPYP